MQRGGLLPLSLLTRYFAQTYRWSLVGTTVSLDILQSETLEQQRPLRF